MVKINPSIMVSNVDDIKSYIDVFEKINIELIHFDVMDGHFVDNIMLGTNVFDDIVTMTNIPIDIHLMTYLPERFINMFDIRKNDRISFHPESTNKTYWLLEEIKRRGGKAGVAISPGVSIDIIDEVIDQIDFILIMAVNPGFSGQIVTSNAFDKIKRVKKKLIKFNREDITISVDGNTTTQNARKMVKNGATEIVVGTSSLLKSVNYLEKNYDSYLKHIIEEKAY